MLMEPVAKTVSQAAGEIRVRHASSPDHSRQTIGSFQKAGVPVIVQPI
jgi:hypothetical protein